MLRRYQILSERLVESKEDTSPIMVFTNPNETERQMLVDDYKIDEHTLHAAMDPDELSLLEFEPNHIAIIFKRPKSYVGKDQLLFKTSTTGAFLFSDRLIIVHTEDIDLFEGRIFNKVSSLMDIILKLIYSSTTHFIKHLTIIDSISEEVEEKINQSMENKYLINLFTLQKSLVYYLNAINSNSGLIERFKRSASKLGFNEEQLELLEDLIIENNQCLREAEIRSNILASLMDARASIVSNNLNILMKLLNIITIGVMVPTLVVSIFSMNVRLPLQQLTYAFWLIIGLATLSGLAVLFIWRRRRL